LITLSADWLRVRWSELEAAGAISLPLSAWDNGDAFTLAELGPLSAPNQVNGYVSLDGRGRSEAVVSVNLVRGESDDDVSRRVFKAPDGNTYIANGRCLRDGHELDMPVELVEVASALKERRASLIESSLLEDAAVAVIGLGTGGIQVAVELAKLGIGNFSLVDPDRLDVGNVARHHAGVSHSGRRKVLVARDLILEKNPGVRVAAHPISADPDAEAVVSELIQRADLVICATDGRPSKLFINRIAVSARKPAIYGGAFRRAYGGQVLRVRPGGSPCYQCFVMAMPDKEEDVEIASAADAGEIAYTDRPVPIEPGLALDVAPIAHMVAKLALNELLAGRDTTLASLERDLSAPWYLWINRPEPGTPYAAWPPLSDSSDEMTILRWYGIYFERESACPVCGNFSAAVRTAYGLEEEPNSDLPALPAGTPNPYEEN
jgi:molybdopterin/thiamine biosynthesis adenylyltransferase